MPRLYNGILRPLINTNDMEMRLFIVAFIVLGLCSCDHARQEGIGGLHDLRTAWNKGDSAVVGSWIISLIDTTLEDGDFYDRVVTLSQVTGFCYGNVDVSEERFWHTPEKERKINRVNTAKVYQLYYGSCLFMKSTTWDETLPLQDRFWNDTTELSSEELENISKAIHSLCK